MLKSHEMKKQTELEKDKNPCLLKLKFCFIVRFQPQEILKAFKSALLLI